MRLASEPNGRHSPSAPRNGEALVWAALGLGLKTREDRMVVQTRCLLSLVLALLLVGPASAEDTPAGKPPPSPAPKHYVLKATPETVQWGWLDPKEPPRLTIKSGDTVSIETLMHGKDKIQKGTSMEEIVALRKANPGGGPHSMTGPIYVEGAEPGDVLEIKILKIVPKKVGTNFNLPGKDFPSIGILASQFPEGHVQYFDLDLKKMQTVFAPGIVLPLKPFPGTLAVGIDPDDPSPRKGGSKDPLAPVSTLRPWKNGSNMDINEMVAGTTVFLPVFLKGGLIWTGDSHCAQGNGEVNLTALECSFENIEIQAIVRKDMKLSWPRIETPTHYIMVGFDESLDKAMAMAVAETVDFLVKQKGLDPYQAYALVAVAVDCRVSQVVDIRKGIHCMVPKSIFVAKH
jgi:acetamidase/formamidase